MPPHPAPNHVRREKPAKLRRGQVMQQDDALDALGRRGQDIAEREDASVIDQHVDSDALCPCPIEQLLRCGRTGEVKGTRTHLDAAGRLNFRFHDVEPLGPLAYQDDAVTQSRQLQGITASDSGTGAGNQSPSGSANDFTAFHITEVSLIPRVSCAAGQGNVCNISCRRNTSAQCNSCGGRTRCGSKRRPRGAY